MSDNIISNSCNSCVLGDQKTFMKKVNWVAFHWPNYISVVTFYMFMFILFISILSMIGRSMMKGKTTKSPEDEL